MRVSAFEIDGERHLFAEAPGGVTDLGAVSLDDLLRAEHGAAVREKVAAAACADALPVGARRLAPLRRPSDQVFVGVNYRDHVAELPPPWKMTEDPFIFSKLNSSIIGPQAEIRVPWEGASVDFEAELMVVIGEPASKLTAANALDHVFGYTVANDVTERKVQATENQLTMAKGMDTFCPMGPTVVLTDEIPDPTSLEIWTTVNGEERQRSNTRELIFSVVDLLVYLTSRVSLQPGDTISTGTPAGVGAFANPPRFLAPGDVVTVAVDGIGELTNPVVAGYQGG
jgi:2-keto-4-pentenoate hydratase/2-oxohepta-3-ene-1,7-dioic acid hydratase in catechol pathway